MDFKEMPVNTIAIREILIEYEIKSFTRIQRKYWNYK